MKKICLIILGSISMVSIGLSQKTINDPNVEKRTVGSFHGIDVATGIELFLTAGSTEEVAVSASETEFRDKIVTKVEGGILKLHYETKTGAINKKHQNKKLKAYVSYKMLDHLTVTTGADVHIEGTLESSSLDLKANTGGLVDGKINVGDLKVSQNTGSKITLTGSVDKLYADGNTGSKFMGEDLTAEVCEIEMSTGAGIYISVEKELNVKANTGGYIRYKGDGGIRDVKTNTGGVVSRI